MITTKSVVGGRGESRLAFIKSIPLSVAASRIRYEITSGNIGGAFAVKNMTGAIYVAGALDYETRKRVGIAINVIRAVPLERLTTLCSCLAFLFFAQKLFYVLLVAKDFNNLSFYFSESN